MPDTEPGGFSLREILERYIDGHAKQHDREREEVELRAVDIRKSVDTALDGVQHLADVHNEAHSREHLAHERIHTVEKEHRERESVVLDRRVEGINEFRGQLKDQQATFVTREVHDAAIKGMSDQIASLERRLTLSEGTSGGARQSGDDEAVRRAEAASRRSQTIAMASVAVAVVAVVVTIGVAVAVALR